MSLAVQIKEEKNWLNFVLATAFISQTLISNTAESTLGRHQTAPNTIDYIIVRKSCINDIQDSSTLSCIDISDHKLVRCKSRVDFWKPKTTQRLVYEVQKLKNVETSKFSEKIDQDLVEATSSTKLCN